jgi:hypothetical protein
MFKTVMSVCLAVAAGAILAAPAKAQVRDAEYRGTLVCGKLPFVQDPTRAAIVVKLTGNEGAYERPVSLPGRGKLVGKESGKVKVDGDKIAITGGWKGEGSSYEASYSGSFVRRSANLTGTQNWTHEGKSYTRSCSGAIKRPLAAFIPKQKKPAQ